MTRRLAVLVAAAGLAFAVLVVRCFWIQALFPQRWARQARNQYLRSTPAHPRGKILDRNGEILAVTLPAKACSADPSQMEDPAAAARLLAPLLGQNPEDLRRRLTPDRRFVPLARGLDLETAGRIAELRLRGVFLEDDLRRHYPLGDLARPLLGGCDVDGRGIAGLEYAYDAYLSVAEKPELRDGKGRRLPSAVWPADLRLTVDVRLQRATEEALRIAREKSKARLAISVVLEPRTGRVLAMASLPPAPLRNPAVQDAFEPGSILKVLTAAAALDEGLVSEDEIFNCENGTWKYLDLKITDPKPMGRLPFADVLAESSNIGFAKLGQRLGSRRLWRNARAFGLGSPTGFEGPGESWGVLRSPESWSGASALMIAFGQEISATPLQIAAAFATVAGGGAWMQPWCVDRVLRRGQTILQGSPHALRRALKPETVRRLTVLMRRVVEKGTGRGAAIDGYQVAGKTGTAQKFDKKLRRYSRQKHTASFCGFLPAGDPQAVILVMLDEPEGDYWAGSIAAPVFRTIAAAATDILNIPPARPASSSARSADPGGL